MEKATVNMTNWELYVYEERYNLSGTADNHPSLGKNTYVSRTSSLVNYTFEDDVLTYETRNTIYICPLKYMNTWPYKNVVVEYREKLSHLADKSESILDKIIAATAKLSIQKTKKEFNDPGKRTGFYDEICKIQEDYSDDDLLNHIMELQVKGQNEIDEMKEHEHERLMDIAGNYDDCVYIEVSNVGCGSLLAYHLGDFKGVVYPSLHSGMFQDSVLYMKYAREDDPCSLDFRYFPRGLEDVMETYSWSDNIKIAVIKNDTDHYLRFNNVDIPIGETKVFSPEGHRQGLISPDCHNGKSVFSLHKKEGDTDGDI